MQNRKHKKTRFPITFGVVLKNLRMQKEISQLELAYAAGIDRTYVSMLERSVRFPSLEVVFLLAKPLGIQASEFVRIIEKQEKLSSTATAVITKKAPKSDR